MQGFGFDLQDEVEADMFTNAQRMDLAGNAFNAFVIYPLMFAIACCAPLSKAYRLAKGTVFSNIPPEALRAQIQWAIRNRRMEAEREREREE